MLNPYDFLIALSIEKGKIWLLAEIYFYLLSQTLF